MTPIADFHTRFFSVLAEAVPGLAHLHYGLSHDERPSIFGMARRLARGPVATLDALIRLGGLDRLPPDSRGLDVGCGLGGTMRVLVQRHGHRLTGVNITEAQVRVARQRLAPLGPRAEVLHGDALALPLPDGSVDYAVMIECAFHVPDKARLFAELARVLRPGGRLVMADQDRADGPLEVMGLFFFVGEGEYEARAEAAGLTRAGVWDLSHEVALWMRDYARTASLPFHLAVVAFNLLRLRPGLARDYWRGVRHFEALLREDLAARGVAAPAGGAVRALRLHTARELDEGRGSYRVWRFDKPG